MVEMQINLYEILTRMKSKILNQFKTKNLPLEIDIL